MIYLKISRGYILTDDLTACDLYMAHEPFDMNSLPEIPFYSFSSSLASTRLNVPKNKICYLLPVWKGKSSVIVNDAMIIATDWDETVPHQSFPDQVYSGTFELGHSRIYSTSKFFDLDLIIQRAKLTYPDIELEFNISGNWYKIFDKDRLRFLKNDYTVNASIKDLYRAGLLNIEGTGEDVFGEDVIAALGGPVEQRIIYEDKGFKWQPKLLQEIDFLKYQCGMTLPRFDTGYMNYGCISHNLQATPISEISNGSNFIVRHMDGTISDIDINTKIDVCLVVDVVLE